MIVGGLKKIFGEVNASERKLDLFIYSSDASRMEGSCLAVVFPKDGEEVQKLVRLSKRFEVPLVARGAGTNTLGCAVPKQSIVVDMCKMHKVLDISKETVTVEAGISLGQLQLVLNDKTFPIDPEGNTSCTIGGMIAMNAQGRRAKEYGRIEDWIVSMEIIDGTGKYARISGEKLQHFIGKEGTTGIILSAILKIIPKPKPRSLNIMGFNTITSLMENAEKLLKNQRVTLLEYWDESVSEAMDLETKHHLFIEYDDEEAGKIRDRDEIENIWDLRNQFDGILKSLGFVIHEYFKVPQENMDKFLYQLKKKGVPSFVSLGPNLVTTYFRKRELRKEEIMEVAKMLKSTLNPLGCGLKCKPTLMQKEHIQLLKEHYDPKYLMNRGKLL